MEAENFTNFTKKYNCVNCNISCSRNTEWQRHLVTSKHKKLSNGNVTEDTFITKKEYVCECNKKFKTHSGLWKHKNKCNNDENKIINSPDDVKMLTSLIMEVVKSNTDLQKQTMEMHQQMIEAYKASSVTNNNMNNCHNKTFNMQVFLNEKCKDAMNLTDFVNSMMLDFSDLEELGELGYVEGISRQMVRKLNEMDVYKRPIHCSDLKRETMYVRDNDVWEKETELFDKLRKAIKYITKKNGDLMIPWRDAHPQCMNLQHPLNDTYLNIMNQAMGGKGEFFDSESKIIRKISKCVMIDKSDF
jgi:hypothetical protein